MAIVFDGPDAPSPELLNAWNGSLSEARRLARSRQMGAGVDAASASAMAPDHAMAQFALAEALLRSDDADVTFFVRCMYYAAAGLFSSGDDGSRHSDSAKFDSEATLAAVQRQPFRFRIWQACFDAFETTCTLGPLLARAGRLGERVYGPRLMERIHQHHSARALALQAALNASPSPLDDDGPPLAIGLGYVAAQRIAAPEASLRVCRPSHHADLQAVLDADPALAARVSALDAQPLMRCLFDDAVVHWLHLAHLNAAIADPPE